jgi:type VI secretion system secreted protein VgrG
VPTNPILAAFSSASRLYAIEIGDAGTDALLVEAFIADDRVDGIGTRDVFVLSPDAHLALDSLLGQAATLDIRLADGGLTRFAGEISEAAMLGSDGGLARYRIRIAPWIWRLAHVRNSRVWQERSVVDIVDAVFDAYRPQAQWRWSGDVAAIMDEVPPRSYCCQYRESDLDFVRRLLDKEGLCWRVAQEGDGHALVLFADSTRAGALPEDASSAAGDGIRYHGARAVEGADTVQTLVAQRRLHVSLTTLLSSDYKAKRIVAAGSPALLRSGQHLPPLEDFDAPGQYAFANRAQAMRHADLGPVGRPCARCARAGG